MKNPTEIPEERLAEAKRKLMMFRLSGGMVLESESKMANSSILKELKDLRLIETTGYEEFRLTQEGRQTTVHFWPTSTDDHQNNKQNNRNE